MPGGKNTTDLAQRAIRGKQTDLHAEDVHTTQLDSNLNVLDQTWYKSYTPAEQIFAVPHFEAPFC